MSEGWVIVLGGLAFAVLLVFAVIGESNERARWEAFKVEHGCKAIGVMRGEWFNTYDGKNIGVGRTSDRTGWACDDGQQYWR